MFSAEALRARNNGAPLEFIQSQPSVSYASGYSGADYPSPSRPAASSSGATYGAASRGAVGDRALDFRNAHGSPSSQYAAADSGLRQFKGFATDSADHSASAQDLPIFVEEPSFINRAPASPAVRAARAVDHNNKADEVDLSRFTREALEARVKSLERLLADSRSRDVPTGTDAELSEHLRVTVKRNRELRLQIEKLKGDIAQQASEREKFTKMVASQNHALEAHIEETTRARELLAETIDSLTREKEALALRCEGYEAMVDELQEQVAALSLRPDQLPRAKDGMDSFLSADANLQDVPLIAEAIQTAMEQLRTSRSPEKSALRTPLEGASA